MLIIGKKKLMTSNLFYSLLSQTAYNSSSELQNCLRKPSYGDSRLSSLSKVHWILTFLGGYQSFAGVTNSNGKISKIKSSANSNLTLSDLK